MNWDLIILLTGIMLFAYWFTFIMGNPLADPDKVNAREILFGLPFSMARRRLKKLGMWSDIRADKVRELSIVSDLRTRHELKFDHRLDIYLAGREFFTWEKSLLCPICLHWWLTILVGAVLFVLDAINARADVFLAAFIYLANHFIIRKIS